MTAAARGTLPGAVRPDLPIAEVADALRGALATNRALVLVGETGSGKSTQLPRLCLEADELAAAGLRAGESGGLRSISGAGDHLEPSACAGRTGGAVGAGRLWLPALAAAAGPGLVAHTQPRRIAARSVAARIALEAGVELGTLVGYRTRFDRCCSPSSLVEVLTDGLLLSELRSDRLLSRYRTVIVDEAHERSLSIDLLLACLRRIMDRRSDLRVVVSSATIEASRFAAFLGDCPVVEVKGRMFPVEVRWRGATGAGGEARSDGRADPRADGRAEPDPDADGAPLAEHVVAAVAECLSHGEGDALVFLPGEAEILECEAALASLAKGESFDILRLYARLPAAEQDRVFATGTRRRVILSTNVAETSLTVPGVRFVIDSGLARIARYSARARIERLPIEPIAQASAQQRAGRCGRVGPGVCIRLYSEESFAARAAQPVPEMRRTNLAGALLHCKSLDLGELSRLPLLDAPHERAIAEAELTLLEIGATTQTGRLTACGRRLARLGVDPRLGKIIDEAHHHGCPTEGIVVAAFLAMQDPLLRPPEQHAAADAAHAPWRDGRSDALGTLRLWAAWQGAREEHGSSALRRWCQERFLSQRLLREWSALVVQLQRQSESAQVPPRPATAQCDSESALHRSILSAFVSNAALRNETGKYRSVCGASYEVHPSSGLSRSNCMWIVCAEVFSTTRTWGRFALRIRPTWIEEVAPHMVKSTLSEPHWVSESGQVAAWQKVSAGSLVLIARRRRPLGPIDPAAARDVFINEALVAGKLDAAVEVLEANEQLRRDLEAEAARRRLSNAAPDDDRLRRFYDERLPSDIHSRPALLRFLREGQEAAARRLRARREDLWTGSILDGADLPTAWTTSTGSLPIRHAHQAGTPEDGATVVVRLERLHEIDPMAMEWGIPERLGQLIEALIRSLPKRLRTRFQPIDECAEGALGALHGGPGVGASGPGGSRPGASGPGGPGPGAGDLRARLAGYLSSLGGTTVAATDFNLEAVEPHLRNRLEIVRADGSVVDAGRDIAGLCQRSASAAREAFELAHRAHLGARWFDEVLNDLPPNALPLRIETGIAPNQLVGYPCLSVTTAGIRRTVRSARAEAEREHDAAVMALARRALNEAWAEQLDNHPEFDRGMRGAALFDGVGVLTFGGRSTGGKALRDLLGDAVVRAALPGELHLVRDSGELAQCIAQARPQLWRAVDETLGAVAPTLEQGGQLRAELLACTSGGLQPLAIELQTLLADLCSDAQFKRRGATAWALLAHAVPTLLARWRKASLRGVAADQERAARWRLWHAELARSRAAADTPEAAARLDQAENALWDWAAWLFAQEQRLTSGGSERAVEAAFARAGLTTLR